MKKKKNPFLRLLSTLGRWGRRMIFGGSKIYADEAEELSAEEQAERARQADVEEVVSPA